MRILSLWSSDQKKTHHKAREKVKPRLTGLISAQQAMDELDIKYKPPLEDARKVYYRVSELLKFLGVENGKV
ncbi:hypothetical protein [Streptococcus cristatus]|uniref:hypothetical protein n=1 Tax=Streptococcus cristatus TaxID=45634 RepID=UPI0021CF35B7|nr:hypothetical protein [Streptococcus cristatus]